MIQIIQQIYSALAHLNRVNSKSGNFQESVWICQCDANKVQNCRYSRWSRSIRNSLDSKQSAKYRSQEAISSAQIA